MDEGPGRPPRAPAPPSVLNQPTHLGPEAAAELSAAVHWYERKLPGLGSTFLEAVERVLDAINARPDAFPPVLGIPRAFKVRRVVVPRFPYIVVYVELADELRVVAVAHQRRRPAFWKHRLPD